MSIVISKYGNRGIRNNGTAHVSEFFYPKSAIERAEGKPLAVFRSATHIGSHVILTELKHKGKNFVAALEVNRQVGKIRVNSIRSLHYRNSLNIINWINEDLADYIKPSFAEEWFEPMKNELRSKPQYNSAEVRTQLVSAANKIKSFENPKQNDGNLRLRTSEELDRDYPNWNDTQTTSKGGHSTQITGTVSTYRKIGEMLKQNGMDGVSVLDASSGKGVGTEALRDMGFDVDDVEPYAPSDRKNAPTYDSYDKIEKKYDVMVNVYGGGLTGQAGAFRHGIARALVLANEAYKADIKAAGFLTRDPRMKERKKYGLKKARKAPQFSKR